MAVLAGFFIMWLVNLSGKPSVKHGIPYPVFARVSMGVFGANFPAMARGLVAMFWYGAQTYAASTAVALLITGITGIEGEVMLLGMTGVMWVSFIFVSLFQVYLFWQGVDLVKRFYDKMPILGVCLGHQSIGQAFGAKIIKASKIMHGKTSKVSNLGSKIFKGLPTSFKATRYHSLVVDRKKFPKKLLITAETKNKTIMGLMHKEYDIHGFQFHPESISTKVGMKLIKNFIRN